MVYSQKTGDGSLTLFSELFGETYHSRHGAITESMHVFIEAGLSLVSKTKKQIRIGEIGLGTGLNAILTYSYSEKHFIDIQYFAIEAFPISDYLKKEVISHFQNLDEAVYSKILFCQANQIYPIRSCFNFCWYQQKWPESNLFQNLDLIYYDAFAPGTQPELWTQIAFEAAFQSLNPGGILVTYCAKGDVKRNMKSAGFEVERLPGPPGKREMTRARKI